MICFAWASAIAWISASVQCGYGTPSMRWTAIFRGSVDVSKTFSRSQGNDGMLEPAEMERGSSMCLRCQMPGYLPPTLARSGPLRLEPHWNGWS